MTELEKLCELVAYCERQQESQGTQALLIEGLPATAAYHEGAAWAFSAAAHHARTLIEKR